VLADGTTFEGEAIGAGAPDRDGRIDVAIRSGEVVFNTVLTGYQEVITDPSYAGQIITFTNPHIGNYGVAAIDDEARRPFCRGVIVRELARRRSNWRADDDLDAALRRHRVSGIAGIDTRRLTRHLRDSGAMPGAFGALVGAIDETALKTAALAERGTDGVDLVADVTTPQAYTVGDGPRRVVAYDFGVKRTMLRHLGQLATVTVVPAHTSAADVMAMAPDGVFLSNGPGDPAVLDGISRTIATLLDQVPIFGICLGHQLLARAIGAGTEKLAFGHHGGNHPVRNLATGRVEITSQNHNFAVRADTLAGIAEMTHVNLNDGVCEGMRVSEARAFSVQYHPEAGPGPHDARYLFDDFRALMEA